MHIDIPLDQMSTEEKLRAIEEIWEDIVDTDPDFPSPAWHNDVLTLREDELKSGVAAVSDWDAAKDRIRKKCNDHRDT